MKQRIFWIGLLLGIFWGNVFGFPGQTHLPEEQGSFRMWIGGKAVGTHSYRLKSVPGGFEMTSKTEITVFVKALFFEQTFLNRAFSPISYDLTIVLPFGVQEVRATCTDDSVRFAYRRGLSKPFKHLSLVKKRPLFLLDNNLMDHWAIFLRAVDAKDSSVYHAFALVPQVLKLLPVESRLAGADTLQNGKTIEPATKIQISFSNLDGTAWLAKSSRQLEKLVIPKQSFVMRRLPTFIPFSLAEKDSLIKGIQQKAKRASQSSYPGREVTFPSDSITLAGTLTLPPSRFPRPVPAVLFLAGSGPLDRNENSSAVHINFFPQLADTLAPNGFATLRFDKRGVGQSGGDFKQADVTDFLRDARAALRFLKNRPEIDSSRVAVLGHSEGAILGLMLASSGTPMGALVMMAGTARNLGEVVLDQIAYLLKLQGKSEAEIRQKLREEKEFFRKIKEGKLTGFTKQGNAGWWREHLQFNPLKAVCKIRTPLLILNGEKDYQVSAEKDARPLYRKAKSCGVDVTLKIYPGLDHLFEPVQGKSTPQEYLTPGRKIPPRVKADLVNWLKEKLQ
ncbi:MAG: alpha/beta fold hydrolase [Calditrichaeota bacterium]|nr:alpha/beta fold hydrolase [Calditrichota bacterium]